MWELSTVSVYRLTDLPKVGVQTWPGHVIAAGSVGNCWLYIHSKSVSLKLVVQVDGDDDGIGGKLGKPSRGRGG